MMPGERSMPSDALLKSAPRCWRELFRELDADVLPRLRLRALPSPFPDLVSTTPKPGRDTRPACSGCQLRSRELRSPESSPESPGFVPGSTTRLMIQVRNVSASSSDSVALRRAHRVDLPAAST